MVFLNGPEDLSVDPGPEPSLQRSPSAAAASASLSACPPRRPSPHPANEGGEPASAAAPGAASPAEPHAAAGAPPPRPSAHGAGVRAAACFLAWFTVWFAAAWRLADWLLARPPSGDVGAPDACAGGLLAGLPAAAAWACPAAAVPQPALAQHTALPPGDDFWDGAAARHWVAETYGFALQARPCHNKEQNAPHCHATYLQGLLQLDVMCMPRTCMSISALVLAVDNSIRRGSPLGFSTVRTMGLAKVHSIACLRLGLQWQSLGISKNVARTEQADDLEPNIGLHWYLAAQLRGSAVPGLRGLYPCSRALLHVLAGARAPATLSAPEARRGARRISRAVPARGPRAVRCPHAHRHAHGL